MLSNEQILANKNTFLKLISEIDIPNADTQGLVNYLEKNNFFIDPASTVYHNNYPGGLCEHSLHVYYELVRLYELYKPSLPYEYDANTLKVVGLLHDISKAGFYEKYTANKKVYSPTGSKHDNGGAFDWMAVDAYKTRDAHDRFLCGTHEENSVYIVASFIPLMKEEYVAILNHHLHTNDGNQFLDQSAVVNQYPLLLLLHTADMISAFLLERY